MNAKLLCTSGFKYSIRSTSDSGSGAVCSMFTASWTASFASWCCMSFMTPSNSGSHMTMANTSSASDSNSSSGTCNNHQNFCYNFC